MQIKKRTIKYVTLTDVCKGAESLFEMLSENAPFTWGDNDHSLVTKQRFQDHLESVVNSDDDAPWSNEPGLVSVLDRLNSLSDDTLIDLES